MSKQNKYVVVDWGSWGIEVQSSSKIIVADANVKEGDDCSLHGTDPATKRPMLFHGQILAVFGSKKEAERKVNELVRPQVQEKEPANDAPRPRREPKPTKKKLAELENEQDDCQEPKRKHARKGSGLTRSEGRDSEEPKGEKAGKEQEVPQKKTTAKKKKADSKDDSEIIAVANLQRVQNLLERRQNIDADYVRQTEVVDVDEVIEAKETDQWQDAGTASAPTLTPTSRSTFSSPLTTSTPSHSYGRPYKSAVSRGHSSVSSLTQFMPANKASVPVLSSPDALQQNPQQEFSISESLSHCSDYDVSDLDLAMDCSFSSTNLHQLQTAHAHMVPRDGSWQGMSPLQGVSNLCTNCQPVLESLSRRLSILEADVEKLRRKQRKHGKDTSGNEVIRKEDENEEKFNGHSKEALVSTTEDQSDAKSATEKLATHLFTVEELCRSSVTGFQCNKDYDARPALSPRRRDLLESIVKKKFENSTKSSIRKDLGVFLKKTRQNKENNKLKLTVKENIQK